MDQARDPDLAVRLFGGSPEARLALLRAAWPAAVGDELARRTELMALDREVLRVKVADLRWQRTLQRMRGDILRRLRRVAGGVTPHALGFVTGEIEASAAPPQAPAPQALPPPAAPPADVAAAAEAIPDAELRKQFLSAAGRYLARFARP